MAHFITKGAKSKNKKWNKLSLLIIGLRVFGFDEKGQVNKRYFIWFVCDASNRAQFDWSQLQHDDKIEEVKYEIILDYQMHILFLDLQSQKKTLHLMNPESWSNLVPIIVFQFYPIPCKMKCGAFWTWNRLHLDMHVLTWVPMPPKLEFFHP